MSTYCAQAAPNRPSRSSTHPSSTAAGRCDLRRDARTRRASRRAAGRKRRRRRRRGAARRALLRQRHFARQRGQLLARADTRGRGGRRVGLLCTVSGAARRWLGAWRVRCAHRARRDEHDGERSGRRRRARRDQGVRRGWRRCVQRVACCGGRVCILTLASSPHASSCHRPTLATTAGYVGTCAGAYLAITAECCDKALPNTTYCDGQTGCFADDWALGFVNIASANPWARGHGPVDITFTDAAVDALQLPASYRGKNVSIMYWQGPILDKVRACSRGRGGAAGAGERASGVDPSQRAVICPAAIRSDLRVRVARPAAPATFFLLPPRPSASRARRSTPTRASRCSQRTAPRSTAGGLRGRRGRWSTRPRS